MPDWLKAIPGFGSLDALDRLAISVTAVAAQVTDGRMWRSLGWLFLGLLLTWWGLLAFVGKLA